MVGAHIHATPAAVAPEPAPMAKAVPVGTAVSAIPGTNEGATTSNRTGVSESCCPQMRRDQHKQAQTSRLGREWHA